MMSREKLARAAERGARNASTYLLGRAQVRGLTREQEVELGRTIERGDREVAAALAGSTVALEELGRIAAEMRGEKLRPADVFRSVTETELADVTTLAWNLEHVAAFASSADSPSARGERDEVVEILVASRLEAAIVDRFERVLRAAGEDAALAGIARGRAVAAAARAQLVEANLRRAFSVARRYMRNSHQLHDLVQEAMLGLMRAAEKFDYRRGFRFGTYAAWWIKLAVQRAALQDVTIHVPEHAWKKRSKGIAVPGMELAAQPVSLDAPAGHDGETRVGDFVADRDGLPVDEAVAKAHLETDVRSLLDALPPRDLYVLRMRFGLDGGPELTLDEIGHTLSVSRERIRQIEARALQKLRLRSEEKQMQSYMD